MTTRKEECVMKHAAALFAMVALVATVFVFGTATAATPRLCSS